MIETLKKILFKCFVYYVFDLLKVINGFDKSFPNYMPSMNKRSCYLWYIKVIKPLLRIDVQYKRNVRKTLPIDVVIPIALKDVENLRYVIENARKYINHPISNIFIVSGDHTEIKNVAYEYSCRFVNEDSILQLTRKEIKYVVEGQDRSGWLFQQLLKLASDSITDEEHFLVLDADTFLQRNKTYIYKNKIILDLSEEHHEPYYVAYKNIFGYEVTSSLSFISHNMLFKKSYLASMKSKIEKKHNKGWVKLILEKTIYESASGFSEYETYGNYLLKFHKKNIIREYWFNQHLENDCKVPNYIKSLSVHSYRNILQA